MGCQGSMVSSRLSPTMFPQNPPEVPKIFHIPPIRGPSAKPFGRARPQGEPIREGILSTYGASVGAASVDRWGC